MTRIPFNDLLFGKPKGLVKTASEKEAKDHAPDAGDQTKKMEGQNYDPYEKAQKDSQAEKDKQLKHAQVDLDRCPQCGGVLGPTPGAPGEMVSQCVNCGYTGPVEYNASLGQPDERGGGGLAVGGPGSFASEYPEFDKEAGRFPHKTR